MITQNAQKAVRAIMSLGDLDLDVFQLPDGSYRFSLTQVAEMLGFDKRRGSHLLTMKAFESLASKEFQGIELVTFDSKQTIKGLTLDYVAQVFGYYAAKGNQRAIPLMMAALAESLERRADAAFNILRTEAQRNVWFAVRADSKLYRRAFTDAIADWFETTRLKNVKGASPNYGKITMALWACAKGFMLIGLLKEQK